MTIEVDDPKQVGELIKQDLQALEEDVRKAMHESAQIGARIVRSKLPVDRGGLWRKTTVEKTNTTHTVCRIVEDTPYAAAQEAGTRPFTPPFEAIHSWVIRQAPNMGLSSEEDIERVAWSVWQRIRTEGMKAKWHTRDALPELREILAFCVSEAVFRHKPPGKR